MHILNVEKLTDEKWVNLFAATYEHGGRRGRWAFASRKDAPHATPTAADAVVMVPVLLAADHPPRLVLLHEFRVPVGGYVYALPAGLLEPGETFEDAARREVREETGFEVTRVKRVTPPLMSSSGLTDESSALVFVDVTAPEGAKPQLDHSEVIEVVLLDYERARQLCDDPAARVDIKAWMVLHLYQQLGRIV